MKLHILIPVYNEDKNIKKTLDEIEKNVRTPHDVTIIYDFEEDSTLPVVRDYIDNNPGVTINLLRNDYGPGALNALKKGLDSVRDGAALVTMADLSDDFSVVDAMAEKIGQGYDLICGSRYAKGGRQEGGPRLKGMLSRLAGLSLHYLTGIGTHDVTNSFKMYSAEVLKNVDFESSGGFEIGFEILVKAYAAGYKIAEVPCVWRDRTAGESRFQLLKWLPNYLHWYFYAIKRAFFKKKD